METEVADPFERAAEGLAADVTEDVAEDVAEDGTEQDATQENAEGKRYRPNRPIRPRPPQSSNSNYNSNYNQNNNYDYNSVFSSLFEQLNNKQTTNIEKTNEPTLKSEDE